MEPDAVRRILSWIDLNVPYYGTSETAYPELIGCRQIYPGQLDQVLQEVAVAAVPPAMRREKYRGESGRGSPSRT